jgi:hypothetical protein
MSDYLAQLVLAALLGGGLLVWLTLDVAARRKASRPLAATLAVAGALLAGWAACSFATSADPLALLPLRAGLAGAAVLLPYVLVWWLPGREPAALSARQRLAKGFAPLFAVGGYAVGLILCLPLLLFLSRRQRQEELDFNFSGWWTDELAAGVYPVGDLKSRAEAGEPPASVCIYCGSPNFARLTRCVACGKPLPPRPDLDLRD